MGITNFLLVHDTHFDGYVWSFFTKIIFFFIFFHKNNFFYHFILYVISWLILWWKWKTVTFERVREETTPYLQTKNPMKTTRWGVGVGIINISLVTCMILVIYPVRIWWFINANLRDNRRVWSVRYETQSKISLHSAPITFLSAGESDLISPLTCILIIY